MYLKVLIQDVCAKNLLSEMTVLSIKSGGWFIWANFMDTIIDTVLDGIKSTNQSLAHRVIIPRSVFKVAAVCGFSTVMYRLVPSANSLILG